VGWVERSETHALVDRLATRGSSPCGLDRLDSPYPLDPIASGITQPGPLLAVGSPTLACIVSQPRPGWLAGR
ncbi:MAG: hypothetical protein ACYTG0_02765, partial [Planctomycetota bacterium]